jgi:hypothetical protein
MARDRHRSHVIWEISVNFSSPYATRRIFYAIERVNVLGVGVSVINLQSSLTRCMHDAKAMFA